MNNDAPVGNNEQSVKNEDEGFIHSKASLDGSKPDKDFYALTPGQKKFFAPSGFAAMLVAKAKEILASEGRDGEDESNQSLRPVDRTPISV